MLKKVTILSLLFIGLSLITINSFAKVKAGPYFGVQVGTGGADTLDGDKFDGIKRSNYGFAGRFYGGYVLSGAKEDDFQYGVELGYSLYQKRNYTYTRESGEKSEFAYKGDYIDLLGFFRYEALAKWNIIGKVGFAYINQKTEARGRDFNKGLEKNSNELLPKAALGLAYDISDKCSIDLMLDYVFSKRPEALSIRSKDEKAINKVASINTVMLGVSYHI